MSLVGVCWRHAAWPAALTGRMGGMVLGMFAGMIGVAAAMFALAGGFVVVLGERLALRASFAGIAGGALAIRQPRVAAALTLVAAIAGSIGIAQFFALAGPLFQVGGLLALRGRGQEL
jgi:hypothetical protein